LQFNNARRQKILAFLMDKMEDLNAHDITRLKAAQLALELSNAIFLTSSEGVLKVKRQAEGEMENFRSSFPLESYLMRNGISCSTLAQYKKAQRQLEKEDEEEGKTKNKRS
jgi:hypothetical protein